MSVCTVVSLHSIASVGNAWRLVVAFAAIQHDWEGTLSWKA